MRWWRKKKKAEVPAPQFVDPLDVEICVQCGATWRRFAVSSFFEFGNIDTSHRRYCREIIRRGEWPGDKQSGYFV